MIAVNEEMNNDEIHKLDWEKLKSIFEPEKEDFLTRSKRELDKYPNAKLTLQIMAAFGVVGMAVLMPGLAKYILSEVRKKERQRYKRLWKSFEKHKLVRVVETTSGTTVEITEEGLKKALKYKSESVEIKKPKSWDKQWRLVIFDVPEKKKNLRDQFRRHLVKLGFYRLNRSVFVHPYPCFDEVEYFRHICGVGEEVTYIVANSIETPAKLNEKFGLG